MKNLTPKEFKKLFEEIHTTDIGLKYKQLIPHNIQTKIEEQYWNL